MAAYVEAYSCMDMPLELRKGKQECNVYKKRIVTSIKQKEGRKEAPTKGTI